MQVKRFDFPLPFPRLSNCFRGRLQVVGRVKLRWRLYSRLAACFRPRSEAASNRAIRLPNQGVKAPFRRARPTGLRLPECSLAVVGASHPTLPTTITDLQLRIDGERYTPEVRSIATKLRTTDKPI